MISLTISYRGKKAAELKKITSDAASIEEPIFPDGVHRYLLTKLQDR